MKRVYRVLCLVLLVCFVLPTVIACKYTQQSNGTFTDSSSANNSETNSPQHGAAGKDQNQPRNIYSHVVIVGVDGGGSWFDTADMPNVDRIFANGVYTENCLVSNPTKSAQSWASLMTGVTPNEHRMDNNLAETTIYDNSDYPTIFDTIRRQHSSAVLGAYATWTGINGLVEEDINVNKYIGSNDQDVAEKAVEFITNQKPELLFVQLDNVDVQGHTSEHGFGGAEHLAALNTADGQVGLIYEALDRANILEETLFIVTSDHGGKVNSHGDLSEAEKNAFFGVVGKSIIKGGKISLRIRDITSIVAWALGIEPSERWDSYIPEGLFFDNKIPEKQREKSTFFASVELPPKNIEEYIDENKLIAGLLFDEFTLADMAGATVSGVETRYEKGFFGGGVRVSAGSYISYPNLEFGNGSFSIATWVKADQRNSYDVSIYSNGDWESERSLGINMSWEGYGHFLYNMGYGESCIDVRGYPDVDFDYNWVHSLVVIDRAEKKIKMYVNFELVCEEDIPEEIATVSFDSEKPLNIGTDGSANAKYAFHGIIDDFLVFKGALSEDEIKLLKSYYVQD